MAKPRDLRLVVFLRGVNVGGHRVFRPAQLAADLRHLDCVNIGAAGTFVIRKRVPLKQLRAELRRRLPFETLVAVCHGENVTRLIDSDPFGEQKARKDVVRFVSVLPKAVVIPPLALPARGRWLVRVVGQDGRFLVGEYRRDMKTIGYLGKLDKLIGAPVTTRNWNTINAIAKILRA
jgi:uncharacterized protein (DUF1697 family)